MKLHRVHFRKEDVTLEVPDGTNLRKACLDNDIDPYPALGGALSCHAKGFCGTCVVGVDEPSNLSAPSKRETRFLKKLDGDLAETVRLSCQAEVKGDVIVITGPPVSLIDTMMPAWLSAGGKFAWKKHPYYSGRPTRSWETE